MVFDIVGPVKKKARELGLIPLKKVKAKPHRD
jgi:hypothetical protein